MANSWRNNNRSFSIIFLLITFGLYLLNENYLKHYMANIFFKGYFNDMLEKYLNSIIGKKLFKEEQKELAEKMNIRRDGKLLKSYESINAGLKELNLPFIVSVPPRKSYRDENGKTKKEKTHWMIGKIEYN